MPVTADGPLYRVPIVSAHWEVDSTCRHDDVITSSGDFIRGPPRDGQLSRESGASRRFPANLAIGM